ncbi:heat shock protein HtpX [Haladaptatus litoreus]|uniref:Heat shock protein HtpX n=1 Tax=Haladaptatus litoreus TaxID=553468 RepID=A0A1N6WB64_9EURY|nr:M48 family metalloprotease [Haladaptatus litoreus]SIQ87334.1 heat shock protein HtpX [Haladaptatus litoreus]
MEWEPDRGLQARMVLTVLLVAGFAVALPVTVWLLATQTARLVAWVTGTTPHSVLEIGALTTVMGVLGFYAIEKYASNELTDFPQNDPAESKSGEPIAVPDSVKARTTKLANQLSVPRPAIECRESNLPTAYTTGRSPENATIVLTSALLDTLDDDELEAVLAHECAHIRHRDFLVVSVASIPMRIAWRIRKHADEHWAKNASHRSDHRSHPLVEIFYALLFALSTVFSVVGRMLLALLSRYRELAADRGAVRITRNPSALAGALRKLYDATATKPPTDLRDAYDMPPERAIVPLSVATDVESADFRSADSGWLETHPSLKVRLEKLQDVERRLDGEPSKPGDSP